MNTTLAPHEALELKELLSSEMLGIKKISTNISIATDAELKNFMQDSIKSKQTAVGNIQSILTQ